MNVNIYTYLDYRHYLTDLFRALKEESPSFSFRSFAKMAGSSSPNFLQLIQARKLNIQSAGIHALSQNLKLTRKERNYFEYLVDFDHAKTHEEKDRFFQQILLAKEYKQIQTLDKSQYELFSHWYIPVIRELVVRHDYNGDPSWIGEKIVPPVSPAKVKKGIAVLSSLGLIRSEGDNRWVHTDRIVSTPSEVLSVAVTTYHKSVLGLAREAIERFPPEERDIRSVTIGISNEGYGEVKKRLEAFWKELLAYAETQKNANRIFQVNMQLFPLSKNGKETI
ncbi:MAG: TIGR02147 family protein [Chitinispirillaceae bacterium]|nr:TIGR02147 family protein [Chitinispirillaceae bacterium]